MAVATGAPFGSADTRVTAGTPVVVVHDLVVGDSGPVSFELCAGQVVSVVSRPEDGGPAIMSAAAGLRRPDAGTVTIRGHELTALDHERAQRIRYDHVGYVLRDIGLNPEATVAENIAAPIGMTGRDHTRDDAEWLARLATSFGLQGALDHRAGALDAGMQQRVGVARALATRPAFVYAEEPIARLSERDGRVVMALLRAITHEFNIALAMTTRDLGTITPSERVIALRDGRIVGDRVGADTAWVTSVLG